MPPADEFDVTLLVKTVNELQRTMMTALQNMLRISADKELSEVNTALSKAVEKNYGGASLPVRQQEDDAAVSHVSGPPSGIENQERVLPCNVPTGLLEDKQQHSGGGVQHKEPYPLATNDNLPRADNRRRNTEEELIMDDRAIHIEYNNRNIPRRGSTGITEAIVNTPPADIEQWHLEHHQRAGDLPHPKNDGNKLREFSARQHKMEEKEKGYNRSRIANNDGSSSSMFSHDMIDDVLDYLEDASYDRPGSHSAFPDDSSLKGKEKRKGELGSSSSDLDSSPPSPRDDAANKNWEDGSVLRITATNEIISKDEIATPKEPNKRNDEVAFITGVWRDVASKYKISDKIVGSGGFGEVRDCSDIKTGETHVVKTIFKPSQDDTTKINLIRNEILLLHEAHHPNIVELRDLFEDDKYVHIVMERCTGGDLFDRVVAENPRKLRTPAEAMKHEGRTANLLRPILQVLKYLHSKGIVHRDIKPEHFLLTSDRRDIQKLKLIDFGLARKHKPGSASMTTFTGSPSFVAPEVIARRYNHLCDMFSVGVTTYFMLTGMLPFDGPTDEETFDLISAGQFDFPSSSVFLSDDAKDFIMKLLRTDPSKRMSASNAIDHPWLRRQQSSC